MTLNKKLKSIGNWCFRDSPIKEINIPSTVTSIGSWGFKNTLITEVVIPKGVKKLEDNTFYECKNLTSVTLPEGLESIGECAFNGYK